MKTKILKVKVGEVYIEGKNYAVTQSAFPRKSKDGNSYYVISNPIFVQEV